MSLMGFKPGQATNHPQQVARRGGEADDEIDTRLTPPKVFDPLHREFAFTLDAAASSTNAKCARYFDRERDGLAQSWAGERVWCNPPFSALAAWVAKAIAETRAGCPLVVMLLPANRTEQKWWQECIEPARDRSGSGIAVRFLRGRCRFGTEAHPEGKWKSSAPFGLAVVIFTEWRREVGSR